MAQYLSIPGLFPSQAHRATDPETEMRAVRAQAALVRTLLAELDDLTEPGSPRLAHVLAGQSIDELAHLAYRMLEAAAAIAPHRVTALLPHRPEPAITEDLDLSDSC